MRLLFVCNEYPPVPHGGIGTFVQTLAHALSESGLETVIAGFDPTVKKSVWEEQGPVRVYRIASPYHRMKGFELGRWQLNPAFVLERMYLSKTIKNITVERDIQLVESYDWNGPLWSHPGPPLLLRMHGAHSANALYEHRRAYRFITFVEKRNLSMADALVGVSRHISELTLKAAGLENRAFEVIYNGVDTSVFGLLADVKRSENEVLFAGTVARRKGIHELFAAIPLVLEMVPSARFTILGRLPFDGNDRKALMKELLGNIPAARRQAITFTGVRPYSEMPQHYNRAACAVFPSLAEAYGLTCAEAMACGAPVIMTSRASGPEIVEHGISGLLCEPTDAHALAQAITSILTDPRLRAGLSAEARARVKEQFELKKTVQENLSLYQRLICSS